MLRSSTKSRSTRWTSWSQWRHTKSSCSSHSSRSPTKKSRTLGSRSCLRRRTKQLPRRRTRTRVVCVWYLISRQGMIYRRHLRSELSGVREDDTVGCRNGNFTALCRVWAWQSRCETCEKGGSANKRCDEDHFGSFEKELLWSLKKVRCRSRRSSRTEVCLKTLLGKV